MSATWWKSAVDPAGDCDSPSGAFTCAIFRARGNRQWTLRGIATYLTSPTSELWPKNVVEIGNGPFGGLRQLRGHRSKGLNVFGRWKSAVDPAGDCDTAVLSFSTTLKFFRWKSAVDPAGDCDTLQTPRAKKNSRGNRQWTPTGDCDIIKVTARLIFFRCRGNRQWTLRGIATLTRLLVVGFVPRMWKSAVAPTGDCDISADLHNACSAIRWKSAVDPAGDCDNKSHYYGRRSLFHLWKSAVAHAGIATSDPAAPQRKWHRGNRQWPMRGIATSRSRTGMRRPRRPWKSTVAPAGDCDIFETAIDLAVQVPDMWKSAVDPAGDCDKKE